MSLVASFADAATVRAMSGHPDTSEIPDTQLTVYCNTADAKVKNDINLPSLTQDDPRLPLVVSAANAWAAILVRLEWGDREQRLPILQTLYDSYIKSINQSGLIAAGEPGGISVGQSSYRTRHLQQGELNPDYYLSSY